MDSGGSLTMPDSRFHDHPQGNPSGDGHQETVACFSDVSHPYHERIQMKHLAIALAFTYAMTAHICTADTTSVPQQSPAPATLPTVAPSTVTPPPTTSPTIEKSLPAPPAPVSVAPVPAKGPSLLPGGTLPFPTPAAVAKIKIGYLDFAKIAQTSKTALKARDSVTASGEKFKKKLTERGKKLEALKKSLEAKGAQMNDLERETKQKEFQGKIKEYQEAVQNAEKEMAKQEETVTKKLIEQVSSVVKAYGEKNGFAMIVVNREILYYDGNQQLEDVTQEIIAGIDTK